MSDKVLTNLNIQKLIVQATNDILWCVFLHLTLLYEIFKIVPHVVWDTQTPVALIQLIQSIEWDEIIESIELN